MTLPGISSPMISKKQSYIRFKRDRSRVIASVALEPCASGLVLNEEARQSILMNRYKASRYINQ